MARVIVEIFGLVAVLTVNSDSLSSFFTHRTRIMFGLFVFSMRNKTAIDKSFVEHAP